jgi:hypothetical protein
MNASVGCTKILKILNDITYTANIIEKQIHALIN